MITNISKKIDLIKGKLSYAELAERIYQKTGYKIHYTTLQKYATGKREPSNRVLKILSAYTGKPISWFIEDEEENENDTLTEYQHVIKKAKDKKIPPSSLEFFIKAVEEARKEEQN
ncbi:MAG: helix-turn-helix transcriptional regulator [Thermosediminibacteraceae bacterium]|nr:helix-turn-helix transcriptional regulator [Thermosediminibacteraceae bacterium]